MIVSPSSALSTMSSTSSAGVTRHTAASAAGTLKARKIAAKGVKRKDIVVCRYYLSSNSSVTSL